MKNAPTYPSCWTTPGATKSWPTFRGGLSAVGALLALVPFWYIWCILREVIETAPHYENAVHVTHYGWMATIAGLLTLLLIFDWRLGLLSLVPVALAFAVMTSMTGKEMQDKMTQYQNALADMSNEAVEYVRGIPVVRPSDKRYSLSKSLREPSTTTSVGSLPTPSSCAGP